MNEVAESLAESLLFEGYALYPYTPEATKNSTPTPFGIAYPTAYAERQPAAFDHVRIEVIAEAPAEAAIEGAALFLEAEGEGHRASRRRVAVGPLPLEELSGGTRESPFAFAAVTGLVRIDAEPVADGHFRIGLTIANTTPLPGSEAAGMTRGEALRWALLSCHAMLELSSGRFVSPLEDEGEVGAAVQACENVNAWPVLASPGDETVLGAAILLPDHPRIAAQSNVNFFDNTEIEEALVLHVQALTDEERDAIEGQDPTVREMIDRADATTQDEMLGLHGLMRDADADVSFPEWTEPAETAPEVAGGDPEPPVRPPPPGPADTAGEDELVLDGKRFRRGGKVVLRPGTEGDPYDRMVDGRTATLERIYLDYDGRAYLGVTIDEDPMREVLRDSGRYLFFFADEVQPL